MEIAAGEPKTFGRSNLAVQAADQDRRAGGAVGKEDPLGPVASGIFDDLAHTSAADVADEAAVEAVPVLRDIGIFEAAVGVDGDGASTTGTSLGIGVQAWAARVRRQVQTSAAPRRHPLVALRRLGQWGSNVRLRLPAMAIGERPSISRDMNEITEEAEGKERR